MDPESTSAAIPSVPATPSLPVTETPKPKRWQSIFVWLLLLIVGIFLGAGGHALYQRFVAGPKIDSFDACVKANGGQILDMYPAVCVTSDGRRFTQPLTDEEKKSLVPPEDPNAPKTYRITPDAMSGYDVNYQIELPAGWKQIEHSSNFQNAESFVSADNRYRLSVDEVLNTPQSGSKTYKTLQEYTGLSYAVPTLTVGGQTAVQLLPRAGSEHIDKVAFFTPDKHMIMTIMLETPEDGSKITEGAALFADITKSFAFLATPTTTCRPRPPCLDSTPRCMIPETADMCPRKTTGYVCPASEWVDCMPGPNSEGIKMECTSDFLTWAKANCPNFKGAAL